MAAFDIQESMLTLMRPWIGSCSETQDSLSAHLDGELAPREARRVARHLRVCRRCQAVLQSLARVVDGVRRLGQAADHARPSVAESVLDRIRRDDD